jgi:chemotaxis methyl-accepting protein methylase
VRIDPALRRWVTFQHLNLMADDYDAPSGLDAVLLRNVLIYFDRDTRRAVISRVARHVRPGGYLLVGTSESLSGLELPFSHVGRSIYRRNDS